jgi:hypothetical protein
MTPSLSAASLFLLEQAKNDNPLAIRCIADASLLEEPVNVTGERLSWCQYLYQSGHGNLWQRALHVLLMTDFNEEFQGSVECKS